MAKSKDSIDLAISHLKGFVRMGASANIKGLVPTGHFDLDFVIQNGVKPESVNLDALDSYDPTAVGIPRGKVVEFFGEEGSGKSSLCYRLVGNAQKMGLACAWIDTEQSYSDSLAIINGVDSDKLIYSDMVNVEKPDEPFYAEQVFDAIIELCKAGVAVIIVDSVANLVPRARMEASAEDIKIGLLARLMSENLGKVTNYAKAHDTLVVFINQLREKIGVLFGSPETTPGGRSLKHNASLRVRISKKGGKDADIYAANENGENILVGRRAIVRLSKNRFAKPFSDALEIPIYYESYFPDIEEIMFGVGRQLKLIKVYKGSFSWNDIKIDGKKNFIEHIKYNALQKSLVADIVKEAELQSIILPPEIAKYVADNNITIVNEDADNVGKAEENEKETTRRRKAKNS
ncbi:MAG: hypothetical protein WDA06_00515 [Phenylobacterium sp.]